MPPKKKHITKDMRLQWLNQLIVPTDNIYRYLINLATDEADEKIHFLAIA
jgi:hypothetical protein